MPWIKASNPGFGDSRDSGTIQHIKKFNGWIYAAIYFTGEDSKIWKSRDDVYFNNSPIVFRNIFIRVQEQEINIFDEQELFFLNF